MTNAGSALLRVLFASLVLAAAAFAQGVPSDRVVDAQVRLDRAGFSPGEIDGAAGANLARSVEAFQRAHQLEPTGDVDDRTRQRLSEVGGTGPALVSYALTEKDVAGPFVERIPDDLPAQATLKRLDYRNVLEALGEKFHASPTLLRRLNPMATFSTAGERVTVPNIMVPDGVPGGAAGAVRLVVRKETSALTVEDMEGRVLFHAPVTSGSEHDPLPIGVWKVTAVQHLPVFHYNPDLFWDADPRHAKARIPPGPNNPVGLIWIDISKEHYGIHGTPEPSTVGHTQSHGCVRLTNWDVERVAQWARPGMAVIFE